MRCTILEEIETQQDGLTTASWDIKDAQENIPCFLDLGFIRPGRDPVWTPETQTAQNRSGVLFLPPHSTATPGNRVKMIKGPGGTFMIDSDIDEAWTPHKLHHLECHVVEVNRALASV